MDRGSAGFGGGGWFEALERRELLSVSFSSSQEITTSADGASSVFAADLDGDGDQDVLSASFLDNKIAWYENNGVGRFGSQQVISTGANGARSVFATDLDGDGDQDVLSASTTDDKIAWYENDGLGGFGPQRVITTLANGAMFVFVADLDGDGDQDVLSASYWDDKIAWYENDGAGDFGPQQVITTLADGARSVFAADLDGDGDQDVLSASRFDDKIAWYENNGAGEFGPQQVITTLADGAWSVFAVDLDGDGDTDVLSASEVDSNIAWYENDGLGGFGPPQFAGGRTGNTYNARSVFAADLDGDGDQDVLSADSGGSYIKSFENDDGFRRRAQRIATGPVSISARSVFAADLNGHGGLDVLSASFSQDRIAWYENSGQAPTDIGISPNEVDENAAAGTVVGTFFAVDPDVGDTHTFTLIGDADGRFEVVGLDLVVVDGTLLDFEAADSHTVVVRATDPDGFTFERTLAVSVNDGNDGPGVEDQLFKVDEGTGVGEVVGVVVAGDPDAGDMLMYDIVGGNEAGVFGIDAGTGELTVVDNGPLVGGGMLTFGLTVEVVDSDGLTDTALVTVSNSLPLDAGVDGDDGEADLFRVVRSGADVLVMVGGEELVRTPIGDAPVLVIGGSGDDDTLVVDFGGGDPVPGAGIVFEGGDGGGFDSLVILGGDAGLVTHRFDSASSGLVDVDGMTIGYTGLEPIFDDLGAVDRVFVFGDGADEVLLGDDGVVENGVSRISSAGSSEVVDFVTPTGTLTVMGGGGDDVVVVEGLDGAGVDVVIEGEGGGDALDASGVGFGVRLIGGAGDDVVAGGGGDDVVVWEDGDGSDRIDGGGGSDTVVVGGSDEVGDRLGVRERDGRMEVRRKKGGRFVLDVGGVEGLEIDGHGGDDRVRIKKHVGDAGLALLTVRGGDGDDKISGRGVGVAMVLEGGNGRDVLVGGRMGDVIDGGAGDDRINGGKGDDLVLGGAGMDRLAGQGGVDTVSYESSAAGVSVSLAERRAEEDGFGFRDGKVRGFENVLGSAFNDLLEGDKRANVLDGGGGENLLIGHGGGDTLAFGELLELDGALSDIELE